MDQYVLFNKARQYSNEVIHREIYNISCIHADRAYRMNAHGADACTDRMHVDRQHACRQTACM